MNNRSIVSSLCKDRDTRAGYLHGHRKHTQQIELLQVQEQYKGYYPMNRPSPVIPVLLSPEEANVIALYGTKQKR